jgi:hypothetical protein
LNDKEYYGIRDRAHLRMEAQSQYTSVYQVDGFWALGAERALEPQRSYLSQITSHEHDRYADPFKLFQGPVQSKKPHNRGPIPNPPRRVDYFQNDGSCSRIGDFPYDGSGFREMPDRVPFMWDFGFMLAHSAAWERAGAEPIWPKGRRHVTSTVNTVSQVAGALRGR